MAEAAPNVALPPSGPRHDPRHLQPPAESRLHEDVRGGTHRHGRVPSRHRRSPVQQGAQACTKVYSVLLVKEKERKK